ncbi:ABC transporter permease [Paenibacillus oceani]|uniref:ABC transporter permease n=1 Tax=Paenibacillus oceani TaxID=2772510 RepID=A0A927H187_9BACL|nr:ABC transporter permease [Paenibacillus oceani]MBD2863912.1 ABC transporter permease [Paenibacillus oceani]
MITFLRILQAEFLKIFARRRNWVLIGVLLVLAFAPTYVSPLFPPSGQDWRTELREENSKIEKTLVEGQLTDSERQHKLDAAALNQYRLDHDMPPEEQSVWGTVQSLSMLTSIITLLSVIVAADSIASEFSWGTIKMLLTRPVGRTKLLMAKYVSVVGFALMLIGILAAAGFVQGLIDHGFGHVALPHLTLIDGAVQEKSMILHTLQTYGLKSVNLLMIVTFAFMISAVARSSSMSVLLSCVLLFTGTTVTFLFGEKAWAKYILFANTNLTPYLDGGAPLPGMTLGFSIVMLTAYFAMFHAAAWYFFTRRDVAG